MARYELVVMSNPVEGRDAEYNDWYDNIHLADVLAVDGIVAARRFRLGEGGNWKYMAIYGIESDDPQAVVQELGSRSGSERMPISEAFDMTNLFMTLAEPISSQA